MKQQLLSPLKVGKFLYLMFLLLILFLISPLAGDSGLIKTIFYAVFFLVLFISVYTVHHNKYLLGIHIILISGTFISEWLTFFMDVYSLTLTSIAFGCAFFLYTACVILWQSLKDYHITLDKIYAVLSVYLLLGFAWGFGYTFLETLHPGTFLFSTDKTATLANLLYFSFVTLTTLGYGDIVPLNLIAKSLSCIEALIGQIFLIVIIARLIGFYVADASKS